MLPKTSANFLQYKIHKRWLLSWIHFIVIVRVTTFECFKMQMVINLAPVSLSNKEVNFYTCPRLTFLKKNATENAYKSISELLDFKFAPSPPYRLAHSALEICLVLFWNLATALTDLLRVAPAAIVASVGSISALFLFSSSDISSSNCDASHCSKYQDGRWEALLLDRITAGSGGGGGVVDLVVWIDR